MPQRLLLFCVSLAVASASACSDGRKRALCAQFDDNQAGCDQHPMECAFAPERTCEARADGGACDPACVITSHGCALPSFGCLAVWPDDGKRTHDNSEIIGCRSVDGSERCELQVREGGTRVCAYRPGKDPCSGCAPPSKGKCRTRGKSIFG